MGVMRVVAWFAIFVMHAGFSVSNAELSSTFYNETCPLLYDTVYAVIYDASLTDSRIGASLIRLHFHDCFVQGCDGSILLNNTATIESEQDAGPNNNSIRGLDVVNNIKTAVENICPATVSCADILAIAAEVGSVLSEWRMPIGLISDTRHDASPSSSAGPRSRRSAAKAAARFIPAPGSGSRSICRCGCSLCSHNTCNRNDRSHSRNHDRNRNLKPWNYNYSNKAVNSEISPQATKTSLVELGGGLRGFFQAQFEGGGPSWSVPLGRRDSLTANITLANLNLPAPSSTLDELIDSFTAQDLNTTDLVALSGAHTFGRAHCSTFDDRLYDFNGTGSADPTLNTTYLEILSEICPQNATVDNLTNLDLITPDEFDNKYYSNLQNLNGLLQSDQELFSTSGADTVDLVNSFSSDQSVFFANFIVSMIKMGNIGVLEGDEGEIRLECNFVNGDSSGLAGVASNHPKDKLVAKSK
ncbi:hypothetical protein Fmac_009459 [Flemingia macrophylla]|uniref:peroxidase n=1 Tax=Flemingia macrophylla TaxID=520843 RepID=A0ABD1N0D5_9FABA